MSNASSNIGRRSILRFPVAVGILVIACLAFLAYWPSLNGGFIWDDTLYLTKCDLIKASDGLYKFWFTTDPIDYWPLSNSSFWLEWRLWGMNPVGYRVTNLILHISSALIIWAVLQKLRIPGAFLAALLFVVHPVNVESVAWIAQRKGLMAMVFFLTSILCFLQSLEPLPSPTYSDRNLPSGCRRTLLSNHWYWLSLATFVLAMLSKGSVAFLPIVLLGIFWWLNPRRCMAIADLMATVPFFIVTIALTAVNVWFQMHSSGGEIRSAGFGERLAGAGVGIWFYLCKALLPIHLIFVYPLWKIRTSDPQWWLPLVGATAVTVALWRRRTSTLASLNRNLLIAWSYFCVALVPVLGFTDVYFMKFSLVADHYQYHALLAVVAVLGAGWSVWHHQSRGFAHIATISIAVVVVGAMTLLTMQQCTFYRNIDKLWESVLQHNPDCWLAHNNLGLELAKNGRPQEARSHLLEALRINPNDADAHLNLGTLFLTTGQTQDAINHYQQALQLNPTLVDAHLNLGLALFKEGHPHEAIEQFTQSLQLRPDDVKANINLAIAYGQLNRSPEAIAAAQKALDLAAQQGQTATAQQIEAWLANFRAAQSSDSPQASPARTPDPPKQPDQ